MNIQTVIDKLKEVIDPEIGINVVDGNMIFDLKLEDNNLYLKFRPTSPTCPIALKLANDIKEKISELKLQSVKIEVIEHNMQDKINEIINSY